jgi:hypothetical protein
MTDLLKQKHELLLDIRYARRAQELHIKLYGRLKILFVVMSVVGGSAALLNALGGDGKPLTIFAGVIFAVFQALDLAVDPGDKKTKHELIYREFNRLDRQAFDLSEATLFKRYSEVCEDCLTEIEAVRHLAHLDNLRENGHIDEAEKFRLSLTFWDKCVRVFLF